ncbi:MAG: acyl-CoA dehydrogenase [Deltaproteobacteria bacterium]|nr:acyl-CoA dehydrogenase [Deltaproteobacteria bacterium]MBM4297776.1 acyl-CoA dehydrogenase [Deltaproteobacteria bacterium]
MEFRLSEEEKLIQETARQFVNRELITREGAFLKQNELFLPPGDPPLRELDAQLAQQLTKMARRIGLFSLEIPEASDGQALSMVARVLIHREFGRTVLPIAPACVPALMARSEHSGKLVAGEMALSLAFAQLHQSGALEGLTTRFRETKDGYVLSNSELDVFDPLAEIFLLPAREEGSQRAGLFVLDRATTGVAVDSETDLTIDAQVGRLILRECKLPKDRLLGFESEIAELVAAEQLRIAARCLGIATRCLATTLEHTKNRVTFGRRLAERQGIQFKLADLSIDLQTATWQTLDAAWHADNDLPYFYAAALAKKRAAKMAFDAADTAIQFHGGYGVTKEFPFETFYRETRMMRLLYGQESEMNRTKGERFLQGQ